MNPSLWRKRIQPLQQPIALVFFTLIGFIVMGYHPGFEDDAVYLTAVKAGLNPALYPHNGDFFRLQSQASVFDTSMVQFVVWTHIPLAWAALLWQLVSLFTILWATRKIAAKLFASPHAQWAAVALVSAMMTLPVAGTALYIADQHLHPRNLATALILIAISLILDERPRLAALPLVPALLLHPIMGALGISFCVVLVLVNLRSSPTASQTSLALAPLGWLFAPATPAWREALASRSYYSLYRWTWYEDLGALAPLLLFWMLARAMKTQAGKTHSPAQHRLARFSRAVFAYALLQQIVAIVMLAPPTLIRLAPLQPMRYLQLVYVFMALIGGGLLGQFILKTTLIRWAIFLLVINGVMFFVQHKFIDDGGAHLELPGIATGNPWLQAFEWIRFHTPVDAYFALDPHYLAAPGEGYHGFRALAERSQLSDAIKDTAVAIQVPSLAPVWLAQQQAQSGWQHFQLADFERLKKQFGVDWVLVNLPPSTGLDCRWHNNTLAVCHIP